VRAILAWAGAVVLWLVHLTCRARIPPPDPRPALREKGSGYIYALLHAHQLSAVCINDDARMLAMVSRSPDGDLLVPSLRLRRVRAVRGSTASTGTEKGGREALDELIEKAREGWPVLLAVDGPRGPRNRVNKGAARAALETGCPVLPVVVVPSRRWILSKTWDRFQIPRPFATLTMVYGEPVYASEGDDPGAVTARVKERLDALEREYDPEEAARVPELQDRGRR
jgi:lysophospholipid acyltransferase (LPLAT)-like uncharacterized protein